jgi:hypothetical protein
MVNVFRYEIRHLIMVCCNEMWARKYNHIWVATFSKNVLPPYCWNQMRRCCSPEDHNMNTCGVTNRYGAVKMGLGVE